MKKYRLLLSTFCLALALTLVSGASTKVFASDGDPQGESRSTQTTPPPPPPPGIWDIIAAVLGGIF
jgi:hypothetical protein